MHFSILFSAFLIVAVTVFADAKNLRNAAGSSSRSPAAEVADGSYSPFGETDVRPHQQRRVSATTAILKRSKKFSSTPERGPSMDRTTENPTLNTNNIRNGAAFQRMTSTSIVRVPLYRSDCRNGQIRNAKGQCTDTFSDG